MEGTHPSLKAYPSELGVDLKVKGMTKVHVKASYISNASDINSQGRTKKECAILLEMGIHLI